MDAFQQPIYNPSGLNLTAYHLGVIFTIHSDRLQALPAIGAISSGFLKNRNKPCSFFSSSTLPNSKSGPPGRKLKGIFYLLRGLYFLSGN
jgi:hypothetical protein